MAPAFRLTTRLVASENMSKFTVDFSTERAGLQKLHFLPGESELLLTSYHQLVLISMIGGTLAERNLT